MGGGVYGSTEEIKAAGQVIVGLMHEDIGHLGIFVSGKVARKEHAQIVSVLKSIEALPPGLYGMEISERQGSDGQRTHDVRFVEQRLEEIVPKLNRFRREDEKPFEALQLVSEFNQRAYELFGRPVVTALASEPAAALARAFHPLRLQRWALSDLNPFTWWLAPAAQAVRAQRQPVPADHPVRQLEATVSELTSAGLDGYRALRDAGSEAAFFQVYGNLFAALHPDETCGEEGPAPAADPRDLPAVRRALAAIESGGYAEALARVAFLLGHEDGPLPLARVELAHDLLEDYRELLPALPREQVRRIGGEQEIIARYAPEQAVESLAALLPRRKDRERLLTLLDRVLADRRVQRIKPSARQTALLARIRAVLGEAPGGLTASRGVPQLAAERGGVNGHPLRIAARRPQGPGRGNRQPNTASPTAARACFRAVGAELAVTWLNEKARPHVEPLARELDATLMLPLDVEQAGRWNACSTHPRTLGAASTSSLHSIAYAPAADLHGRVARQLARRLRPRDEHLVPLVRGDGAPGGAADGPRRRARHHELSRRRRGRGALRDHGSRQSRARGKRALPGNRAGAARIRVNAVSPGPIQTRAASGIPAFGNLMAGRVRACAAQAPGRHRRRRDALRVPRERCRARDHGGHALRRRRFPHSRMRQTHDSTFAPGPRVLRNRTFDEIAVGDHASIQRTLTAADIQPLRGDLGRHQPAAPRPEFAASTPSRA
jgi:hypothetical protein